VCTLAVIDHGVLKRRFPLLLAISALTSTLAVQANTADDSRPVEYHASSSAIASCTEIKNTNATVWPVDEEDQLLATSVVSSVFTNRVGRSGTKFGGTTQQAIDIEWTVMQADTGFSSMQIETSYKARPYSHWVLNQNCEVLQHKRITYNEQMIATELLTLNPVTQAIDDTQALNPPIPKPERIQSDVTGLRVGMIDSGVNYTLPQINARLARDEHGELIGYDFWENDALPFDVHFSNSAFRVSRHGTGTASLLLTEAPFIDLVPYRYPRPDMTRMQKLIEHAADNDVRIIGLPLGGNKAEEWTSFVATAKEHPDILFIASAGNNGRNIDQQPVYPASLELANLLVVTSADDFAVPADRADRVNWGRNRVDYMLPAEGQTITNFEGVITTASGSSYAVPRAVAMAARFMRDHPQWRARDVIAEFARLYADGGSSRFVGGGYIADPLADADWKVELLGVQTLTRDKPVTDETETRTYKLPLSVYVLHDEWSTEQVSNSLLEAESILAQCNIVFNSVTISELSVPPYLRDLETGSARTLISALNNSTEFRPIKIFFARQSRMQSQFDGEAFGRANTRRRSWMQDSVWLVNGIEDAGIALAHELFHVLSNSGEHNSISDNLMQTRTSPGNVKLEPRQCDVAISNAKEHAILFD